MVGVSLDDLEVEFGGFNIDIDEQVMIMNRVLYFFSFLFFLKKKKIHYRRGTFSIFIFPWRQGGPRLIELCEKFALSAEDVFNQWMAYASSGKKVERNTLSLEVLGPFEVWMGQATTKSAAAIHSTPKAAKKVGSRFLAQVIWPQTNPQLLRMHFLGRRSHELHQRRVEIL